MILLETRIQQLFFDELHVLFGGPDEIDSLEVHEFFGRIIYLLYEIDVVLVEFGLGVYDGDDAGCLPIQEERLHLRYLRKDGVEVVFGNGQQIVLLSGFLPLH